MSAPPPNHTPNPFYSVIDTLQANNIPLENLIRRSLLEPGVANSDYVERFLDDLPRLLGWLAHHEQSCDIMEQWMKSQYNNRLTSQLRDLTKPDKGFHFNAGSITAEKMRECTIEKIAQGMETYAPDVWELVGNLLEADPAHARHREKEREHRERERRACGILHKPKKRSNDDGDNENHSLGVIENNEDEPEDIEEQLEKQRLALLRIKRVTCISIMMQATNQRCNSMQALVGVFLQSSNTSEQTRNFLSHLGVSISVTTINRAIKTLSRDAYREIQRVGTTLLTSYTYDNLDVNLVHSTPTVESSMTDTLVHLTTASMFPLHPMTTKDDLQFSDQIRQLATNPPPPQTIVDLMAHLPRKYFQVDDQERTIQDRFNSWKFLFDLINYGPPGFSVLKDRLGEPEEIDCIPLTKTKQVPLRASRTSPGTPANNAIVMEEFFRQSNIVDNPPCPTNNTSDAPVQGQASSTRGLVDPENTIIPVFGDLLTGQHIHSLQDSRINNVSPAQRFQAQVYCHGWFHTRMACADAVWRRHILNSDAEKDPTSLIKYVIQIRPLEKHKIHTDPTFRQLHEVITHVGIVLRLDAWRVEVCRRHPEFSSLEEWVQSIPKWEELVEIAAGLADVFVPPSDMSYDTRKEDSQRDKVFEITRAYHKDFLLYEETNYAMNHGDMGRLDACLMEWIPYFMGCTKTKYAQESLRYLERMYVLFPKPLARAIRMNSLVNPTGRKEHFRGIDWVIEHNNLYIKRIFRGAGSNHTVDRMIAASPLIEVYKDIRGQFEQMFCLTHKTTRHSPPKMKHTFAKLQRYMEKHRANEFITGRSAGHILLDTTEVGMRKLTAAIEQAQARLMVMEKEQEQLRAEAEQSNMQAENTQMRPENSQQGGTNYERDTEDEERDPEAEEGPAEDEEPEAAEETGSRLEDDGSLFVDEVFE